MSKYFTDIALDDNFQPVARANGDFAQVTELDCLMQEIKIEALTTAGELFFDTDFGWSLPDFTHAQSDELTLLEIKQRIRSKLSARAEVDANSIEVTATMNDTVQLAVLWRFVDADYTSGLHISINSSGVEIEVVSDDQ